MLHLCPCDGLTHMSGFAQPPRRDFVKLMNLDKIVLRFGCRMVSGGATEPSEADQCAGAHALDPLG